MLFLPKKADETIKLQFTGFIKSVTPWGVMDVGDIKEVNKEEALKAIEGNPRMFREAKEDEKSKVEKKKGKGDK